jgi:hypothetical protein
LRWRMADGRRGKKEKVGRLIRMRYLNIFCLLGFSEQ